ncbi:hypothetical protein PROFUN_05969 [Planoprotostelium fungivorum]|uniref:Uncharacterized protein n=1 Tax=Planoprotostelium fungivorum TaxID=1890364 RepID=A0A2P6NP77_9EUKA|nr:hypothetical protein PROFUN_05969 [Planoprotostelium fungivorum]
MTPYPRAPFKAILSLEKCFLSQDLCPRLTGLPHSGCYASTALLLWGESAHLKANPVQGQQAYRSHEFKDQA